MTTDGHAPETTQASRRRFVASMGTAVGAAMMTDWRSRKAFAATNRRIIGANERIQLGHIGVGSMGGGHLNHFRRMLEANEENVESVAVCDIYKPRLAKAQEATGGKAYSDYKALLDDKDIDGVVIATPEHWHMPMAMDAIAAGKDMYLEKPLARYLPEAIKLRDEVKKTGTVLQLGAQYASEPKWYLAKEKLPILGKVLWSQTSYCRNSLAGEWNTTIPKDLNPEDIDWKAFLGPAEQRPFDPERFFRWRKFWDYSSGIIGDLFPHRIYPLMIVLGAELPTRVVASGGLYVQKDREVPDTVHMMADFPSGHTMVVAGCTANQVGLDQTIRGNKATMELNSFKEIVIRPEAIYAEEVDLVREEFEPMPNSQPAHRLNFIKCMRTREAPACNIDLAFAGMVAVALAEDSYRLNKVCTSEGIPA